MKTHFLVLGKITSGLLTVLLTSQGIPNCTFCPTCTGIDYMWPPCDSPCGATVWSCKPSFDHHVTIMWLYHVTTMCHVGPHITPQVMPLLSYTQRHSQGVAKSQPRGIYALSKPSKRSIFLGCTPQYSHEHTLFMHLCFYIHQKTHQYHNPA